MEISSNTMFNWKFLNVHYFNKNSVSHVIFQLSTVELENTKQTYNRIIIFLFALLRSVMYELSAVSTERSGVRESPVN